MKLFALSEWLSKTQRNSVVYDQKKHQTLRFERQICCIWAWKITETVYWFSKLFWFTFFQPKNQLNHQIVSVPGYLVIYLTSFFSMCTIFYLHSGIFIWSSWSFGSINKVCWKYTCFIIFSWLKRLSVQFIYADFLPWNVLCFGIWDVKAASVFGGT